MKGKEGYENVKEGFHNCIKGMTRMGRNLRNIIGRVGGGTLTRGGEGTTKIWKWWWGNLLGMTKRHWQFHQKKEKGCVIVRGNGEAHPGGGSSQKGGVQVKKAYLFVGGQDMVHRKKSERNSQNAIYRSSLGTGWHGTAKRVFQVFGEQKW